MAKPLMCPPELLERNLSGRTYIVTGANSGIGAVTVTQLVKQGATVILACRRLPEGEKVAEEIRAKGYPGTVRVEALDLASLASVREFAARINKAHNVLHGLVNNAGVMNTARGKTKDGFETQLGVNHLGHFLLTELLVDLLRKGEDARIVTLSSCYHDVAMGKEGKIVLEDLNFEKRPYHGWTAYAQSKLANLLHARELARRLRGTGITAVSVHPGWVRTALIRNTAAPWLQDVLLRPFLRLAGMIEPWEGAQTSLFALLSPEIPAHSGEFYSQTGMYRKKSLNKGAWPMHSPNPEAHDAGLATRLYDASAKLVGITSSLPAH